MRLREVFRYELQYRLRSFATWCYAPFLALMMFWFLAGTEEGAMIAANAPQKIAHGIVLFGGLFGLLVSAALFGDASIRDASASMDPLLYTTRLRKVEYLGGRFLATLLINAIVVLALPLGFWSGTLTVVDATSIGPNRLAAYAQPMLLFVWPNLVLVGAIQFTIGSLSRQVIPVYLATAAVFAGYLVAANYWSDIQHPLLSALADPLGINALFAMTRYWTPSELEAGLIGFPTMLVVNRVLWLAIAAAILAVLHRRFRFAHPSTRSARSGRVPAPSGAEAIGFQRNRGVPRLPGVFGTSTRVRQTFSVARQSLVEVVSGRGFQVGVVAAIGLTVLWGQNVGSTAFDTPTWPVTHLVVGEVLSRRAVFLPWFVIALYAGELVWKHREVGAAEIVDAAPVPTGVALLGRFLALIAIIVAFNSALMVGGVLVQILGGYYNFELGLYLRVLFGLNLLDHVLLAAMAMTIHVLVNQKYVGHMIVLLGSAFKIAGPMSGVHRMLVYDSDPGWTYSDMNGFGPYLAPFLWFKAYWASWALLLFAIAILFWVRGPDTRVIHRLAQSRARFRGPLVRTAAVAVALILVIGGFLYYNISILNDYRGRDEAGWQQVEYERRYKQFESAPQPVITDVDLRVEIHPDDSAADIRGSYQLMNQTGGPIDSVHVVLNLDADVRSISLDRGAKPVVVDEETGYRTFALEQALQPGDSLRLSFDSSLRPRGFRGTSAIQTNVIRNGSYFDRRLLPFIGYQPALELADEASRKRFGLVSRPRLPSADDAEARRHYHTLRNENAVRLEVIVGTAADQTAIVSAPLRRTWTENGRRYFHYGTDEGHFAASVFSARYAVRDDRWHPSTGSGQEIQLQIFHHPEHQYNVDRMIESMKASLDYCTRAYGPYQFRELRVVEIPYAGGGRALLTTVAFGEPFFITRVNEGGGDMMFFGTAHEVAHSWWAGQVRAAPVRGREFLSETLANYSAMMVTEKRLGPEHVRRIYDFQMDRYLSRRSAFERDVPLVDVDEHPHIAYGKGAVAMYTLREHLGDETVNGALRRFVDKRRGAGPPYPTAHELVAELRAVTPDSLQHLIADLFETITLWDVKTERAIVARKDDGQYEVTLDVVAKKMRADSAGVESDTPMDDLVEIGVFREGDQLYLNRHRIRSGRQTVTITVPREPSRAGIDPWRKLIDRNRDDNIVEVKIAS